jgi:hypothetical protein
MGDRLGRVDIELETSAIDLLVNKVALNVDIRKIRLSAPSLG